MRHLIRFGLAAVVAGLALATPAAAQGTYGLEIDGVFAGFVQVTQGGNAVGEVVEERMGPHDTYPKKHLASLKYNDIVLHAGANMAASFYDWLSAAVSGNAPRRNGAIVAFDFNYKERSRREFTNALIAEIGFPAADATAKDAATLAVVLRPETTRLVAPRNTTPSVCQPKSWLTSNFRMDIAGLDASRVRRIEPFGMRVVLPETKSGDARTADGTRSFPHVVLELPESHAQTFYDWFDAFVADSADSMEKTGSLEYLAPNLSDILFSVGFHHLGIFEIAPVSDSSSGVSLVIVRMYVEHLTFKRVTAGCGV